jgi:hypothetical protein
VQLKVFFVKKPNPYLHAEDRGLMFEVFSSATTLLLPLRPYGSALPGCLCLLSPEKQFIIYV